MEIRCCEHEKHLFNCFCIPLTYFTFKVCLLQLKHKKNFNICLDQLKSCCKKTTLTHATWLFKKRIRSVIQPLKLDKYVCCLRLRACLIAFLSSRLPKSALKFARFYILCHREVLKNVYPKVLMWCTCQDGLCNQNNPQQYLTLWDHMRINTQRNAAD